MEIKRICIVTETFSPEINGVANTLNHLVQGLRDKAIQVQIIRPQHPAGANEEAGLHTDWVRSMSIPGYSELRMGLPTQREVKRQLQAFDPQVIYVATEGPLGFVAVKAARKLNIPVLSGFHTNFHQYFRHYHLGLLTPLAYRYLRYFHNKTQGTLVPTQEQAAELTRVGFANMQVLSRGVNAALFNPQKRDKQLRRQWGLDDEDVAVIYVGRLAAEKNIALAIESFRQMKHEDVRVKLIMVGDGPLAEKLADENPGVIFYRRAAGEDLARHYASADIFLFPSLTDTFGNVVLEAMASGLAVVAFDYAAARSNIQSDENGILIPFADEGRFAERSQSLVDQPNLLRQIRHKARQHAETLRWEAIVEQFTRQLRGIITGDMQNGSVKSPLLFHKADLAEQAICQMLNRFGGFRYIRYFFKSISRLGDGVFWYSLMLALPLFHGLQGLKLMGHIIVFGMVSVGLYKLLKSKLVRERPFISFANIQAHTLPLDKYSFPSGHTMNAVNFAIMFCWFFPQLFWVVVPFAALVGLSRIVLGMHYPTDVLVGAACGASIAWASTTFWPLGIFN